MAKGRVGTVAAFSILGIAILVIVVALLVRNNTSAPAPQGVSLQSYNSIDNGMTVQQVQSILGTDSRVASETSIGGIDSEILEWQGAFGTQVVTVSFENGVVIGKSEAGL